jgi:hypothetical protein
VSRRARVVFGLIAIAAITAGVGAWLWRRHVEELARIAAERETAELAAIERSVGEIVERARADTLAPGISAAFALADGRVGTAVAGFADAEAEVRMRPDTRFPTPASSRAASARACTRRSRSRSRTRVWSTSTRRSRAGSVASRGSRGCPTRAI